MSADVLLNDLLVIAFALPRPLQGCWTLQAEVQADLAPRPGPVVLSLATERGPHTFHGTAIHVGEGEGRATVFAVGGAGGLRHALEPEDYGEILPRLVAEDILRDAGEKAGDLSGLEGAPKLERWSRVRATASASLSRLCATVAELVGEPVHWRVNPAGEVDILRESWPTYKAPEGGLPFDAGGETNAHGRGALALDAPDLAPGMVLAGQRVSSVVYELAETASAFRVRYLVDRPEGGEGRERTVVRRLVERILPPAALGYRHRAHIVDQEEDGRVGVVFDDDSAPMLTAAAVPVYMGLPGARFQATPGDQVLVEFLSGDERRPAVTGFLVQPSASAAVVRVGDGGEGGTLAGTAPPGGGPVSFVYTPPGGGPGAPSPTVMLSTLATEGSPEVSLR